MSPSQIDNAIISNAAAIAQRNAEDARLRDAEQRLTPRLWGTGSTTIQHVDDFELRQRQRDCIASAKIPAKYFKGHPEGDPSEGVPEFLDDTIDGKRQRIAVREKFRRVHAQVQAIEKLAGGAIIGMLGDRGAGKSREAVWLVKRFVLAGRSAIYHEVGDFLADIRATMAQGSRKSEREVEAEYLAPKLLILDALEERSDSEFSERMFVRLVNRRLLADKITVLISNDTSESFVQRIGRSLADRLHETGSGVIVFDWPSLRGRI